MPPLTLAVFDCDGTLVDSQASIVRAMSAAFEGAGEAIPPREAILGVVGLHLGECMQTLAPHADSGLVERLVQGYRDAYRTHRASGQEEPPLYPHTRAILADLDAAGIMLSVATGKSRRGLRHTLNVHGLTDLFADLRTSDDGPGKPNPTILLDLCASLDTPVAQAVMIGDTVFDIEMAVHAGMAAIGVNWGYHTRERLLDAGAYTVIDGWEALIPALSQRFTLPS